MDLSKELEQALDRLKNAQTPDEIRKAVAIAEIVKLMVEREEDATCELFATGATF